MGSSNKVTDDAEGNVMDIALGSLRARKIPMLKVENRLHWILDENLRPAIVVGYGTDDPEKMSSIHHIIKFHVRKRPIFNVVSAMVDYAVKHTRVATPNVVIYDDKIPGHDIMTARNFLEDQYNNYVVDVAEAFRGRGLKVPLVDEFEDVPTTKKGKGQKVITKHKTKMLPRGRVAKKTKTPKAHKRVRFIVDEEDDEDGPIRRLTPTRTVANTEELQIENACADKHGVQSSSERADSLMSNSPSDQFVFKQTAEGLALVFSPDTPLNSTEDHFGLGTPTSMVEDTSGSDMLSKTAWSFSPCDSSMLDQRSACPAQKDLFLSGQSE
ncbi:hypothetical protein E4T43_02680 [Aureobasidium subglaciale]|nr:hypothetical protein E4T43_02680 [Aureobasidium subglaciale]